MIAAKDQATRAFLAQQAFPLALGARESVNNFRHRQCKLAIVTGAGLDGVTKTIAANGFEGVFQTVVSGDDVAHSKPAPDCYQLALNRLSLQASDCLAIEDSENGVRAAFAARIPCIAISTAMSKHDKLSDAMCTFNDLNAASTWIALFQGDWAISQLWLFWIAPIVGAVLAGVVYRWFGDDSKA